MTEHHFLTPFGDDDEIVTLIGEEARHAVRSLRIRPGELITISNGATMVRARVIEASGDTLRAEVEDRRARERPRWSLVVCPAVPKGGKLDEVIEDLTELGVDAIEPWFAERSIPRWDVIKAAAQAERWRKIALAAAKQSRRFDVPGIGVPTADLPYGPGVLVLHPGAPRRLRDVGSAFERLVTGPEGGLTGAEIARFEASGAVVASLGDQVLRTETAAVAGATLLLQRAGRIG